MKVLILDAARKHGIRGERISVSLFTAVWPSLSRRRILRRSPIACSFLATMCLASQSRSWQIEDAEGDLVVVYAMKHRRYRRHYERHCLGKSFREAEERRDAGPEFDRQAQR